MPLHDQGQAFHVCPRCQIMLPLNQSVCYNCGLQVAYLQSGNPASDTELPFPEGSSEALPDMAQVRGGQTISALEVLQTREVQTSPSLGISQMAGGQTTPIPGMPQKRSGETPALGMPQAREEPTFPILSIPRTEGGQTISSIPFQMPFSARKDKGEKDQSFIRKHATLFYLSSVVLIIVVIAFVSLRAAGISLSGLIPQSPTKNSEVAYPLPEVTPLFADSFANDASGWNLQSSPGSYQVNVGNGALTLNVDKNKLLWEPLPGAISYSDFALSVHALLAKGDQNNGYGLYIRGAPGRDSDLATYYRFELYGDASYAVFKGVVAQNGTSTATQVVNYTLSSVIQKQGKPNTILLLARGSSLSFIVNGQLLQTFTDASYPTGSIALFASNLPQAQPGMQVQFSQFALYPLNVTSPS